MTEVAFHSQVPDKLAYCCRLLRKATASGAKVWVQGEPAMLQQLDAALWTFSALDFVPHCLAGSDAALLAASPVVLGTVADAPAHHQVLLNLSDAVPTGFESFERVIEIVSLQDDDRRLARLRWKHYTGRGYPVTNHEQKISAAAPA